MPQEKGLRKGYVSRTKLVDIFRSHNNSRSAKERKRVSELASESKSRWVYVFDENKKLIEDIKGVPKVAKKYKLEQIDIHNTIRSKKMLGGLYFSYNQFFDKPDSFI